MELTYKSEKLKNLCENPKYKKQLQKDYGKEVADKLPLRIVQLKSFPCLNDVPTNKPYRRHKLEGKRKERFAVNINDQYRIEFIQNGNKGIIIEDLREIKKIEIVEVSKHYGQ